MPATPSRPRSTLLSILLLWLAFYASFTLFTPALLDDADSVHAEVAREMLLRHDCITLYANGIRYLEKAPLLYWAMALSMKLASLFGATSPRNLAAAARLPLAFAVLALALLVEAFTRRLFHSTRAGLYAALILLSSCGIFIYSHLNLPDAFVCLWITLALYCFYRTEELAQSNVVISTGAKRSGETPVLVSRTERQLRLWCGAFAAACALNVLTKGLIGVIFPVAIVALYLLLTRGLKLTFARLRELHPLATLEAFLLIATPWHILAGLANPTQGQPAPFRFINHHWLIPLPTDGNVRGWFWFYFINEHVLRYLNLRIPHDYDTVPLWLFWGLCFIWLMPWSAFVFKATTWVLPFRDARWRTHFRHHDLPLKRRGVLLLAIWAAFVLLFFSLSTRQEYYVLPALPAVAILIAGWLSLGRNGIFDTTLAALESWRVNQRIGAVLLAAGTLFALGSSWLLLRAPAVAPGTDLASLLSQNPNDYALSMGHFLDLTGASIALNRVPLSIAALSLFLGPLAAYLLRRRYREHAANLALAAGAFTFLLAAHLALQNFAPVLTSAQLAQTIAPQVHRQDMIAIHGEYESASSLGFYLQRDNIHIVDGRSSNLWYGSFFPDSPPIFETPQTLAAKWPGPQRIFLWQSLTNSDAQPNALPLLPAPVYILVKSGGKEIVSNQPNR